MPSFVYKMQGLWRISMRYIRGSAISLYTNGGQRQVGSRSDRSNKSVDGLDIDQYIPYTTSVELMITKLIDYEDN